VVDAEPVPHGLREARRRWAELRRRIFEVDPLQGPRGGHEMRIVAFITQPAVIDRLLAHRRRTATASHRWRAPPPRWASPSATTSGSPVPPQPPDPCFRGAWGARVTAGAALPADCGCESCSRPLVRRSTVAPRQALNSGRTTTPPPPKVPGRHPGRILGWAIEIPMHYAQSAPGPTPSASAGALELPQANPARPLPCSSPRPNRILPRRVRIGVCLYYLCRRCQP
jgi:hypothetical protein